MKLIPVFLLSLCYFTACKEKNIINNKIQVKPIDSLFKDYFTFKKRINPLEATKAGFNEYNDQLANYISTPYKKDLVESYTRFLSELDQYDSTMVTPSQWMSVRVMKWDCNLKREGLNNAIATIASPMYDMPTFELFPIMQIQSLHLYFSQLASGNSLQPFHTVNDYDNWLKRVDAFLPFLDTCIAKMNQGIARGVVLPKVLIKKMIPQSDDFINVPVAQHLFFEPNQVLNSGSLPLILLEEKIDRWTILEKSRLPN